MNNKEFRRYRSAVRKKLLSMGIKDESVPIVIGKKRMITINPTTFKQEVVVVPRYQLQNINRRMVNQLVSRDKGPEMADTFLSMDASALKGMQKQG